MDHANTVDKKKKDKAMHDFSWLVKTKYLSTRSPFNKLQSGHKDSELSLVIITLLNNNDT